MFYNASSEIVFAIVFDLTSEIYYGWWLRNIHSNGASFFFICVYLHMARGIYYCSFLYPRQLVWISGGIIWILMIATAFLGYILPWGQMSFWGAMVITSLLGALPGIGADILLLLWGSYSIDQTTLHRFYSLHYTLPFIIFMLTIVHFALLHEFGSNNGLGLVVITDNIPFLPYYGIKDLFSIIIILVVFFCFVIIMPDKLGHSDNFILANSLVTPAHIVPEWYFLPLYTILRSISNKLFGIFMLGLSICCLILLPFMTNSFIIRSSIFRPWYRIWTYVLFFILSVLMFIGACPILSPWWEIGFFATYFHLFLYVILPIFYLIEKILVFSYYEYANNISKIGTRVYSYIYKDVHSMKLTFN